jgi:ribosomal protein S27AE
LTYSTAAFSALGISVFHLSSLSVHVGSRLVPLIHYKWRERSCSYRQYVVDCWERRGFVFIQVLDFSSLKDYMTKGGLVLQTTKCPECGAPMALPTTGNQTKCEHCGNIVYAQDIFEKVKSLIG